MPEATAARILSCRRDFLLRRCGPPVDLDVWTSLSLGSSDSSFVHTKRRGCLLSSFHLSCLPLGEDLEVDNLLLFSALSDLSAQESAEVLSTPGEDEADSERKRLAGLREEKHAGRDETEKLERPRLEDRGREEVSSQERSPCSGKILSMKKTEEESGRYPQAL